MKNYHSFFRQFSFCRFPLRLATGLGQQVVFFPLSCFVYITFQQGRYWSTGGKISRLKVMGFFYTPSLSPLSWDTWSSVVDSSDWLWVHLALLLSELPAGFWGRVYCRALLHKMSILCPLLCLWADPLRKKSLLGPSGLWRFKTSSSYESVALLGCPLVFLCS